MLFSVGVCLVILLPPLHCQTPTTVATTMATPASEGCCSQPTMATQSRFCEESEYFIIGNVMRVRKRNVGGQILREYTINVKANITQDEVIRIPEDEAKTIKVRTPLNDNDCDVQLTKKFLYLIRSDMFDVCTNAPRAYNKGARNLSAAIKETKRNLVACKCQIVPCLKRRCVTDPPACTYNPKQKKATNCFLRLGICRMQGGKCFWMKHKAVVDCLNG